MDDADFPDMKAIRDEIGLSQQEMAAYLGVSTRAVQSCEQGWRSLSSSLEKCLLLFWLSHRRGEDLANHHCWEAMQCAPEMRESCFTYMTRQGHMCWFLNSSKCTSQQFREWPEKKEYCRKCAFFIRLFRPRDDEE